MPGSVAHYNLLEHIGEGVFGDVYRARDTKVGRTVALKLQREPLPEGRRHERLVDDARAAAALENLNQLRDLLAMIKTLGLTDTEYEVSRKVLLAKVRPANIREEDFSDVVTGPSTRAARAAAAR